MSNKTRDRNRLIRTNLFAVNVEHDPWKFNDFLFLFFCNVDTNCNLRIIRSVNMCLSMMSSFPKFHILEALMREATNRNLKVHNDKVIKARHASREISARGPGTTKNRRDGSRRTVTARVKPVVGMEFLSAHLAFDQRCFRQNKHQQSVFESRRGHNYIFTSISTQSQIQIDVN